MSTVPVVPVVKVSWLKTHERLLIVAMVLLVGTFGLSKYFDAVSFKADQRATVAEATLATQKVADAQQMATVLQLTQQYQVLTSNLTTQNATLAQAVATRQTALGVQKATDAHLAPSELSTRLESLANAPVGSVTVTPSGFALSQPGAVAVVQALDQIPVLQANLSDETVLAQAETVAKAKGDEVIAAQATQIVNLNTTITDSDKACKLEVAATKAAGRKNSMKWFRRGFGLGFLSGLWAGHAIGI